LARDEGLQQQSIKQACEIERDAIMTSNFLLSVLESTFFQRDVLMQQVNVFASLEKSILDTANKLRELNKQESSKSMLGAIGATATTIEEEKLTRGHYPTLTSLCVDLSTDAVDGTSII
jgi:hypothetical protein